MEQEFFNFLRSSNNLKTFNYGDNSKAMIYKVPYDDKLDILYCLNSYSGELFDLQTSFDYAGIYDKESNRLFDLAYEIECHILKWEYGDERAISGSKLHSIISKDMNEKIRELVNDSIEDIFDLNNAELGEELDDKDVIHEFMEGYTHQTLEDKYVKYSSHESSDILEYLSDKDYFLDVTARDFILNNHFEILKGLTYSREQRKVLKQIEENEEHPYHKIKAIVGALKDKNYVTVNVSINKNGIDKTFKYSAANLADYDSDLSSYKIEKASDKREYEECFGRWSDFDYADITKITYGKNIVYEDNNFVKNKSEEEDVLTR